MGVKDKNGENIAYYETIRPITVWSVILSLIIVASPIFYFNSPKLMISLVIASACVMFCVIFLLYGRYTIQIDDTAIAFGYRFIGKEKVLLNTVAYAEIFIFDLKNPIRRFVINALGRPPIWISGTLIRLRLNEEYLTRYKLGRKKRVRQLFLLSKQPESVLSVLSEKSVPVQSQWTGK